MHRPWIVPVAGFLGAGKTSLILAAARLLQSRGHRPAAILNDQGHDLVDTAYSSTLGIPSDEVAGACFCCRFSELIAAADRLRAVNPEVIFIEPVGSCTDLAATLVRPLQRDFLEQYQVAPLTVVIDPTQARQIEMGWVDASIKYLFEHQLAEADIVVLSKSDLPGIAPKLAAVQLRRLSAVTGAGISGWLDEVLSGQVTSGTADLSIDYGEYASAEAALAWLNWSAQLEINKPIFAAQLLGPFLDDLQNGINRAGGSIAHLKMLSQTEGSYLKAAVTHTHGEPTIEGDVTAAPARIYHLRVNIRAVLAPESLERLFREALNLLPATWTAEHFQCFSPGKPVPERRIPALTSS